MGLTVRRKTAKNLAVRRKNERILAVSRKNSFDSQPSPTTPALWRNAKREPGPTTAP